jgi:hypothetical protein
MPPRSRVYLTPAQGTGLKTSLKKIGSAVLKANDFLRKHKIVSNLAKVGALAGVPYADKVATVSSKLGYGKKRGGRRKRAIKSMSMLPELDQLPTMPDAYMMSPAPTIPAKRRGRPRKLGMPKPAKSTKSAKSAKSTKSTKATKTPAKRRGRPKKKAPTML